MDLSASPSPGHGASLVCGSRHYTAAQLEAAVAAVKTKFQSHGFHAGRALILRTHLADRYVLSLIAAVQLGCCVVPVDPSTPRTVVEQMAGMTGAAAVIGDSGIVLITTGQAASGRPARVLGDDPNDAGYVLFTSGSTGKPKGVVGSRRGLAHRIEWGCRQYFSPDVTRCAIKTNPGFIDSLTEILSAYHCGRAMIVAPVPAQRDLGLLCEFIGSADIEQITMTPSCIPTLVAVGRDKLRGVRRWIFSGEELRRSWLTKIRSACPRAVIINSYGSTEVCGDVTHFVLAPDEPVPDIVPIGRPAEGVKVRMDAFDGTALVEPRASRHGELWVGGSQVAHGYIPAGDSEQARFELALGDRWFRTGDIVAEAEGQFYYLGRTDDHHKVRGRRISLSGVAEALETVDGVAQAHAWISEVHGVSSLRAAVVPEPGVALTPGSVVAGLRRAVLPHLVPDRVDVVDELRRTASGKVELPRGDARANGDPPPRSRFATGLQHVIATVVSGLVGDSSIGATTPITEVGVDSLSAVGVAEELRRYLGCPVTALDVLAAGTVAQLAERIPALQADIDMSAARLVRSAPSGRTLLLLHPAVGTCLGYFPLLQHICYDGDIVFVEQNDLARTILSREGMEALAVHYAQEALNLCPDAAIDVTGYSFGALIAPSVIRALHRLGGTVSAAVLIDPATAPARENVSIDWALRRILTDSGYGNRLPAQPLDGPSALRLIREAHGPLSSLPGNQLMRWADSLRFNVARSADYEPTTMPPVPTLVVRATRTAGMIGHDPQWFHTIAPTAARIDLDTTHFELLQGDSVGRLAAAMSQFLNGAAGCR